MKIYNCHLVKELIKERFSELSKNESSENIFYTADTTSVQSISYIKASSAITSLSEEIGEFLAFNSNVPIYCNQWLGKFQILNSNLLQPMLLSHNLNYNCYGDCFTLWLQVAVWGGSDTGVKRSC